ncbi:hypothetical protein M5X11_39225 [Paenibacillus alginolyticus]|uniref:hypothetical protein n=1 Tax=Paenibacillus alginolyticus TaxID=59839 RepID=UPI000419A37F|nr:hypothetical protein [Paenibacillus alginolyticus]MCY9670852.1 hypothetical protein [Paenibacillus alginolyticus]
MKLLFRETNLILYKKFNNTVTTKDYLKWANTLAESDVESDTLYMILSMSTNESLFVFEEYYDKALYELGISIPGFEECARTYLYFLCKEIINGTRNNFDIVRDIFRVIVELNHPVDLSIWMNLDEDIDRIIYDDKYYKPNETEVRDQILVEAKKFIAFQEAEDIS